jgi:superfamily II DNA or RNA helicase
MLQASKPLSPDEIVEALAKDSFGPTPGLSVVERELRSDGTRYVRIDGKFVHLTCKEALDRAAWRIEERSRSAASIRAPRRELTEAWVLRDERLWRWQAEALAAWQANQRRGIVSAVTGAGKTNVAIAAMREHVRDGGCAVVLVPTQELMHQWAARIREWASDDLRRVTKRDGTNRGSLSGSDVLVCVVNTAVAQLETELRGVLRPVMLVADECHRYGAETFRRALRGPYVATLGLSATPERSGDAGMQEAVVPTVGPVVYRYDYDRALADGVISEFGVTFVGLDLSASDRERYEKLTKSIADSLRELMNDYPELEENPYLFEELEQLIETTHDRRIADLFRAVTERQQILQNAPARRTFVQWLAQQGMPGARGILFHSRIEGCEELAGVLRLADVPAGVHHSGLTKNERRDALHSFERGRVRVLCSPRTLDEGIDVPDADFALIVAGSTVTRQRIQRLGRVLRKADGKTIARGFVLYIRDTVEDPRRREDPFALELQRLERASWTLWPEESETFSVEPVIGPVDNLALTKEQPG